MQARLLYFLHLYILYINYIKVIAMMNIGEAIKEELDRQDRTVSWLARKLNRTRTYVYRLLSKNSIDTNVLAQISLLLGRDFFLELSQEVSDTQDVHY